MVVTTNSKYLLFLLLVSNHLFCQTYDSLLINVSKSGFTSTRTTYNLVIKNYGDSTACILHSDYIDLNDPSTKLLAEFNGSKSSEVYRLVYTVNDTAYIVEKALCKGEILLPHQSINFQVSMPNSLAKKYLSIEYVLLADFCYKPLFFELKNIGNWYTKYKVYDRSLEMPEQ